jgi:hypothetical protein
MILVPHAGALQACAGGAGRRRDRTVGRLCRARVYGRQAQHELAKRRPRLLALDDVVSWAVGDSVRDTKDDGRADQYRRIEVTDEGAWSVATELDRIAAILDIQGVLQRYARAVDRDDWTLLRSCYHDGAIDEHGRYNGDIDGLIKWLQGEMPRYESTMHCIHNMLVEVHGDRAVAETYCIAYHRVRPDQNGIQQDRVLGVRYVDQLSRDARGWRISHRRCVYEFSRIDPVPFGSDLVPAYARGARGQNDPSYAQFAFGPNGEDC